MAILITWVLFFVLRVELVTAFRDNHAVAYEKGIERHYLPQKMLLVEVQQPKLSIERRLGRTSQI